MRSEVRQPLNHRYAKIQNRRSASSRRGRGLRRCRTTSCCRRQTLSAISNNLDRMAAAKAHGKQRSIDLSCLLSNKQEADAAQRVNQSLPDDNFAPYSELPPQYPRQSMPSTQRATCINHRPVDVHESLRAKRVHLTNGIDP